MLLFRRQGFFAHPDFRVGAFFNFFQNFLAGCARRQFGNDDLPLTACQVFNFPASPDFHAAATMLIEVGKRAGRTDDLSATGEIRSRNNCHQFGMRQFGIAYQGNRGFGNFAQVV